MKSFLTIIFFLFISIRLFSQQPVFEWADQCGNPPNTTDTKTTLAAGHDGNFYLAGEFLDTVQFGNKTLVSAGGTDIFLVKYTEEGTALWTNKIGAADYDYVQKVITDDDGNVIVTGYFYGTTQIGQDQYTSYGSQDIFIAKFNSEGAFLWSYRAGGPVADYLTGLSPDTDQNLIITGYFYDMISFGDTTVSATYGSDIYLAKFGSDGELLWVNSAGGSSSDQARSASCDPNGNILLTGSFYYDITLGDTTITTMNPVGAFIAKYLPDGQLDQAFQLDGTYLTPEIFIIAGKEGDFYISGNFSEQLIFGDKTFDAGEFNQDIFTAKYDSSCELQWARHAYSVASDQVIGIEIDDHDNLYLTGHYLDTINFDLLTLPYTLCCGSREIFIVNYSAAGNVLWGERITGTRANVQSIAMNAQGELLLSGLFTEEVILGDLKLSNFDGFLNYVTCLQAEIFTQVDQSLEIQDLKIFPNPSRDRIQIINPVQNTPFNYFIYNLSGRLILNGTVNSNEDIKISILAAGQYLLQLIDPDENSVRSCFFIKQ